MAILHVVYRAIAQGIGFPVMAVMVGCASVREEYPSSWPPKDLTVVADGCPDVSGKYRNRPSDVSGGTTGEAATLRSFLERVSRDHGPIGIPTHAASVALDLHPERLDVRFLAADGSFSPASFRRYRSWRDSKIPVTERFTCQDSAMGPLLGFRELDSEGGMWPFGVYTEGKGARITLHKARDGSLVVQWHTYSFGLSVLVIGSHMRSENTWLRYEAVGLDN